MPGWVFQLPGQRTLDEQLILVPPRLRDPSAYSVVAGRPTLLAMGDSYTEGYPVGGSLSCPAEIVRILDALRLFVTHILPNVRSDNTSSSPGNPRRPGGRSLSPQIDYSPMAWFQSRNSRTPHVERLSARCSRRPTPGAKPVRIGAVWVRQLEHAYARAAEEGIESDITPHGGPVVWARQRRIGLRALCSKRDHRRREPRADALESPQSERTR